MAIIPPTQARQIQRPQPMARTTAQITNVVHAAIVAVVVVAMHDRVRIPEQAVMIVTAHATHAPHTIPMQSPQAKATATQHSPVSMASIQPRRRASPTGCSMILAMGLATARLRSAPIPVHLATQAVRWIARRDATEIIVKSVPKAHRRFASVKARATA